MFGVLCKCSSVYKFISKTMKFHLIFNINIFAKYPHDRELTFSRESWKGFIEAMARVSGNGFYAAATLQTKEGRIPGSDRNPYAGG